MNIVLKQFEDTIDEIQKLKGVPESLLIEPIRAGKWSIREIVGHLYYWDKFNLEKMVPLMTNGANLPQFPDHDKHNAEGISNLADYSLEAIIDARGKLKH